jgi:hypothetical protein
VGGSILDTNDKLAAYNATLTYLANLGRLPVTGPLLTYTPILPLPIWPRGVGGGPQALPVIWEAPDDPDNRLLFPRNLGTHDCVTHREQLKALTGFDALCTIPAGGTIQIEGWVTDSPRNPIQSGFTAVAYPDWIVDIPGAPILISPNGTINTSLATFLWKPVPTATYYQLAVGDSSGNWVINKVYAASEAGCAAGTGTCSLAPATPLASGSAKWLVAAWNPAGWGPWSTAMSFVVNVATDPIVGLWNLVMYAVDQGGQVRVEKRTTGDYAYVGIVTAQSTAWKRDNTNIGDVVWQLNKEPDGHYKGQRLVKFFWLTWGAMNASVNGSNMTLQEEGNGIYATKAQ